MWQSIAQSLRNALSAASAAVMSMVHGPAAEPMLPIKEFYMIMKSIFLEVDPVMDDLANRPYRDMRAAESVHGLRREKGRLLANIDALQRRLKSWEERQPIILQYMRALEPLVRELKKAREILHENGYDVSSIDATLQSMKDKYANRTSQNAVADRSLPKERRVEEGWSATIARPFNAEDATSLQRRASRDLMPPPRIPLQQRQYSDTARDYTPTQPYDIPHHRGTISPSLVPTPRSHHARPYGYGHPEGDRLQNPSPNFRPYLRTSPSFEAPFDNRRFERSDTEAMYYPSEPEASRYQNTYTNRLRRAEPEPEPEPLEYIPDWFNYPTWYQNHLNEQAANVARGRESMSHAAPRQQLPVQRRVIVEDGELDQQVPRTRLPPPVTPRHTPGAFRSHIHTSSSVMSPFFGTDIVTAGPSGSNVSGRRARR